ncbi:Peptidase U9, T4 prohead protease [uncultured Caudovirales phage]|uniref:Peptidase U9, T4 prohead protease n=1 Tax=uncultured Caudovirales phage TaxID=2100421 RepID=A0A6J5PUT7_9CAUD|nr:Peptidase U9, T4 prohead protease [uncultured Caudovirales phage]CAB4193848.1 Peptidase U9, T4 prohead protease [uncultured Caudovirales phage]
MNPNTPEYNDWVLIVENVGEKLQVQNSSSAGVVLEGVCAVFGQMNNNRRVYEKSEYLPHLTYLQEKITRKQLVGTVDHPQHFEPKLGEASHIIEALTYDGGDKVYIKVRLLENTPHGKLAKALIDGGVQLSISSRAAGQVSESGYVKLQRIFTYDLVGEPGFTEAVLRKTVSESLKSDFSMITESYNSMKEKSFIHQSGLSDISESLNFADNFKVYKINKLENSSGIQFQGTLQEQKNNNTMAEFVTKEQMDKYSEVLKTQFNGIKKEIKNHKSILESAQANETSNSNSELVGFINYLAESLEGVINFTDYLSHKLNESVRYTEHVAETTNSSIEYSSYLGEKLNQSVNYQEHVAEKVNQSINYAEYIKESLNNSIKYQNYLAEEVDKGLQYTEYVAQGTNRSIEFGEYLSENINQNRDYSQYLAEKVGESIGYAEYIGESIEGGVTVNTRNILSNVGKLDESNSIDALISKVDQVITEVNDKSSKAVLESKYPFLKVMNEANKKSFFGLESNTKQAIVEALNGSVWFNENDIVGIMEAVVNHKEQNIPIYIRFMPAEYKPTWNEMNEAEQGRIHAKAQLYTVNTPYQAKAFWDDVDMRGINERIEIQKNNNKKMQQLNESQSTEGLIPVEQVVEMQRGYSHGYLETMLRSANSRL